MAPVSLCTTRNEMARGAPPTPTGAPPTPTGALARNQLVCHLNTSCCRWCRVAALAFDGHVSFRGGQEIGS